MALERRVNSSSSRLVIPWSKSRSKFVVKKKDLESFNVQLPDDEMRYMLDAIKYCKYYIVKVPKFTTVRSIYLCF